MALNYERIGWENAPSTNTPIDAGSLNHMDNGILAVSNQYDVDVPYLQEQVAGIPAMLDSYLADQIGIDVINWLDQHVTPGGSTVVVDDTLSVEGAAAESKTVGDALGTKANTSDVISAISTINDALDTKANASDVTSAIGAINDIILPLHEYNPHNEYSPSDWAVYNGEIYECLKATTGTFDSTKWRKVRYPYYVEDIKDSLAVPFRNDYSYRIEYYPGDYCIYCGILWKCTNQTSDPPLISGINTNWKKITVTEEISSLKNALTAVEIVDSASGTIASFADGSDGVPVKGLKVQLEPIQDLHGYDHPWPAGGGKNLLPLTVTDLKSANTRGTWNGNAYTSNGVTFTIQTDNGNNVVGILVNGTANPGTDFKFVEMTNSLPSWLIQGQTYIINGHGDNNVNVSFQAIPKTGSNYGNASLSKNNDVSFALSSTNNGIYIRLRIETGDVANNLTMKPVFLLSTESDSSFAPYSNVCPISGRTGVTVTRTGKNLFGGTFNEFFPLHFESDKTVIVSADPVGSGTPQMGFYDENEVRIDWWGMDSAHSSVSGRVARVIELPKESYYVKFICDESTRYMIELGNTNTTFESYVGNTYNITFPSEAGTVYGGTLDVTQGVLTVDTAYDVYDGSSDEGWTQATGGYAIKNDLTRGNAIPITNMFPGGIRGIIEATDTFYNANAVYNYRLGLSDSSVTDLASFKVWLSNNPIQVCCKIAQPVTVQLTPQQLTTLLGQNNVWSDADSVAVDYVADTKLYIEQLTEPDADMVADMNITSGKYFMVGNSLYLATANIANGAAITVGVNCTRTSLAEALNAINS